MSEGLRPGRYRPPPRRQEQAPDWARDMAERLDDMEKAQIALTIQMQFLVDEAKEQKVFRQRVYWLGLTGLGLLILQAMGFDVQGLK